MNPLDFLEPEELLRFFHCNKTEISCMENPHIFLCKLKDYNLIPEDSFKKVSRMKKKENMERGLYEILDSFERERSQHIKLFWKCAFKETILSSNPKLQMLRNSLMDGSFHFDTQLPENVEMGESGKSESKKCSEDEERQENSVKKKRKLRRKSICDEEDEQPGPSRRSESKKSKKICFSPLIKKGAKDDIWTWPLYKTQLPVKCGTQEGTLQKDKLARGEKCILVNKKKWLTPGEFEKFAGKKSCKNWKLSIRCRNTPLAKLIKEGHLKSVTYKRGTNKAKKSLFPLGDLTTESEGEDEEKDEEGNLEDQDSSSDEHVTDEEEAEEQTMQQPEASVSKDNVFKVTCGVLTGTLHKKRFVSGILGKSIRTETSWMTPIEFCKASHLTNVSWQRDIICDGKPLGALIEAEILTIHSLTCPCQVCNAGPEDLENQNNDDECCICKNEENEQELVQCDACPRSFHQKCHLPHVDDAILRDSSPWLCTFCVFGANQECYDKLETNVVMLHQISQHMMQCHYLILCLRSADEEQMFSTNPLKNYNASIKTPMWLGKVTDKLQQNQYQTVGEFVSDVQLIFANCATYNRKNPEILAIGDQLKQLFDSEFKKAFNIQDE